MMVVCLCCCCSMSCARDAVAAWCWINQLLVLELVWGTNEAAAFVQSISGQPSWVWMGSSPL